MKNGKQKIDDEGEGSPLASGIYNYKCELCGRKFSTDKTLSGHNNTKVESSSDVIVAAHILMHMSRDKQSWANHIGYGDRSWLNGRNNFSKFGFERVSTNMDIDDTKNSDTKTSKLVVKLKIPYHFCDNKEKNDNRPADHEIGELSQSGSRRIIQDFDLNEPPKSE